MLLVESQPDKAATVMPLETNTTEYKINSTPEKLQDCQFSATPYKQKEEKSPINPPATISPSSWEFASQSALYVLIF